MRNSDTALQKHNLVNIGCSDGDVVCFNIMCLWPQVGNGKDQNSGDSATAEASNIHIGTYDLFVAMAYSFIPANRSSLT